MKNIVHLGDCMEAMRDMPDNAYDLAIVDPPYGINWMEQTKTVNKNKNWKQYACKDWDKNIPSKEYFLELFRVTKNQIIWGGNYMTEYLNPSPCWLIWDKIQEFSGADFEMAWTSYSSPSKAFRMARCQAYVGIDKVHPTQKPVKLYEWLLKNYAKEGDTILDTHVGSGSSRIAAHKMGFDFEGWEIDADYWNAQERRYKQFTSQTTLF